MRIPLVEDHLVGAHGSTAALADIAGAGPFDPKALAARIQAACLSARPCLAAGGIALNPATRTVTMKHRPLRLTGKEYALLELLMLRRGAVLTKAVLLDHLYPGLDAPAAKIIDVFVCKLRRKLGKAGAGALIGTVRGHGYVLRDRPAPAA